MSSTVNVSFSSLFSSSSFLSLYSSLFPFFHRHFLPVRYIFLSGFICPCLSPPLILSLSLSLSLVSLHSFLFSYSHSVIYSLCELHLSPYDTFSPLSLFLFSHCHFLSSFVNYTFLSSFTFPFLSPSVSSPLSVSLSVSLEVSSRADFPFPSSVPSLFRAYNVV